MVLVLEPMVKLGPSQFLALESTEFKKFLKNHLNLTFWKENSTKCLKNLKHNPENNKKNRNNDKDNPKKSGKFSGNQKKYTEKKMKPSKIP